MKRSDMESKGFYNVTPTTSGNVVATKKINIDGVSVDVCTTFLNKDGDLVNPEITWVDLQGNDIIPFISDEDIDHLEAAVVDMKTAEENELVSEANLREGIEVEVYGVKGIAFYDYQPKEPQTLEEPGCDEEVTLNAFCVRAVDIQALLSDDAKVEIENEIFAVMRAEAEIREEGPERPRFRA